MKSLIEFFSFNFHSFVKFYLRKLYSSDCLCLRSLFNLNTQHSLPAVAQTSQHWDIKIHFPVQNERRSELSGLMDQRGFCRIFKLQVFIFENFAERNRHIVYSFMYFLLDKISMCMHKYADVLKHVVRSMKIPMQFIERMQRSCCSNIALCQHSNISYLQEMRRNGKINEMSNWSIRFVNEMEQ